MALAKFMLLDHIVFMPKNKFGKPIEIKISTVVAMSAILHESDLTMLDAALKEMTGGVSDFFDDEFAVVDVGALDLKNNNIDWTALITLLKSYRLNPVAVRNADPELTPDILAHGLSLDVGAKPRQDEMEPKATAALAPVASAAEPAVPLSSMIIDTPVRAGQRIYARDADLIITAAVNNGAEVIADGSIHVYASLRGRALAGPSGNASA